MITAPTTASPQSLEDVPSRKQQQVTRAVDSIHGKSADKSSSRSRKNDCVHVVSHGGGKESFCVAASVLDDDQIAVATQPSVKDR